MTTASVELATITLRFLDEEIASQKARLIEKMEQLAESLTAEAEQLSRPDGHAYACGYLGSRDARKVDSLSASLASLQAAREQIAKLA